MLMLGRQNGINLKEADGECNMSQFLNESPDKLNIDGKVIPWYNGITFIVFNHLISGNTTVAFSYGEKLDFHIQVNELNLSKFFKNSNLKDYTNSPLDHENLVAAINSLKPIIEPSSSRSNFVFSGRVWKLNKKNYVSIWNNKSVVDSNKKYLDKLMGYLNMTYENTLFEFADNQGNYKSYSDIVPSYISTSNIEKLQRIKHTADPRFKNLMKRAGIYESKKVELNIKLKNLIKECYSEILKENSEMIKNDLHKIIDYSEKLQLMIKKEKDMEDWVKAKLTHAADYIDTVFDYLRFYERDEVRHVMDEKWSNKYKKSIDCNNPKGFSQKSHCAARKKRRAGGDTKSKPVNETLSEESNSEMSLGDLRNINAKAKMLQKMIKPTEELEDWVKAKLNLTGEYLDDVFHHIDYHGQEGRELNELDWKKALGTAMVAGSTLFGTADISASEPKPIDKPTQQFKYPYTVEDIIAATLVDEAGGEKDAEKGMIAVMNVLMNRANGNILKAAAECLKPKQFSGWNVINKSDINSVNKFIDSKRKHAKFSMALKIVSQARSGNLKDITSGADHFLNINLTKLQSKTSSLPSWFDKNKVTVVIGNHTFLRLKN